jgi:hypothetical protein
MSTSLERRVEKLEQLEPADHNEGLATQLARYFATAPLSRIEASCRGNAGLLSVGRAIHGSALADFKLPLEDNNILSRVQATVNSGFYL